MSSSEDNAGPVIRDRRRIDPATGLVREPNQASTDQSGTSQTAGGKVTGQPGPGRHAAAGQGDTATATAADETAAVRAQLDERTADLQRLQAEYANYRKRVERDRAAVREYAVSGVLTELLPALDAIGIARDHGELSGVFKSVADQIQAAMVKLGLSAYGQKGDPFDPKIHEALTHSYSPDVAEDTCVEIFQPGYKVGERILRPARVAVAEPETAPDGSGNAAEWPSGEENN